MTVSAPKDVSILYALGDEHTRSTILRIHGEGVQAAAEYLQANAGWARQYNADTKTTEAVRAKLVMPEFVHRTARPVTDPSTGTVTVDPQLHTHITVPTWVQRPDGSWSRSCTASPCTSTPQPRAPSPRRSGATAWSASWASPRAWSTARDVSRSSASPMRSGASSRRRSLQIEAAAAAYDVTTRSGREVADARHPRGQARGRGHRGSLRHVGTSVPRASGSTARRSQAVFRREPGAMEARRLDVQRSVDMLGVHGLTARQATFTRRDLIRAAASHAPLGMSRAQLEFTVDWILADRESVQPLPPRPRDGETEPEAMLRWGRDRPRPPLHHPGDARPRAGHGGDGPVACRRGRRDGPRRHGRGGDGDASDAHRGPAGHDPGDLPQPRRRAGDRGRRRGGQNLRAGRSAVKPSMPRGWRWSAAPSPDVPPSSSRRDRTSPQPRWQQRSTSSKSTASHGGVLVVDEAGMLGDRQLAELVSLAARDATKVVVVGDPFQLQPIEAGAPMRILSDHIGRVELHENIRQQYDWERATLRLLRDGEARAAYREYERYDRIHDAHSVAERRVQVIEDHARLEAGGLNRSSSPGVVTRWPRSTSWLRPIGGRGRVHGPALSVGDKEYQVGDRSCPRQRAQRSGQQRHPRRGHRGRYRAPDADPGAPRQAPADPRHHQYDAIDRGYALTVHKAQGMTADIALVVGSEGATREWAYTAMSRATLATHYYEVFTPPERDTLGVEHWKETSRSAEERTVQAWTRSELKESALDYPERYETPERITVEDDLRELATDRQRALVGCWADPSWPKRRPGWKPGRRSTAWWLSVPTTMWRAGCVRGHVRRGGARAARPRGGPHRAEDANGGPPPPRGPGCRRLAHPRDRCAAGSCSWSSSVSRDYHPTSRRGRGACKDRPHVPHSIEPLGRPGSERPIPGVLQIGELRARLDFQGQT